MFFLDFRDKHGTVLSEDKKYSGIQTCSNSKLKQTKWLLHNFIYLWMLKQQIRNCLGRRRISLKFQLGGYLRQCRQHGSQLHLNHKTRPHKVVATCRSKQGSGEMLPQPVVALKLPALSIIPSKGTISEKESNSHGNCSLPGKNLFWLNMSEAIC